MPEIEKECSADIPDSCAGRGCVKSDPPCYSDERCERLADQRHETVVEKINVAHNGDLVSRHPNGDRVRLHVSRFHGLIVTAARTYIGNDRPTEVAAYFGDPRVLADWLAEQGFVPRLPSDSQEDR